MNNLALIKKFGFDWFIYSVFDNVYQKIYNKVNSKIFLKRVEIAKNYLINNYYYVIRETLSSKYDIASINHNCKIFVLWEQGLDNMPPIVKSCYNTIITHSSGHEVILIDKDNIGNYYKEYNKIRHLFESGKFKLNFLSDLLKGYFLYTYGGIWIDATIFLNKDIDNLIDYNSSFYTINHGDIGRDNYNKWSAYFFASCRDNPLFYLIYRMFFEYIINEDKFIYYFLIDAVIEIAYEYIYVCRNMIDKVDEIGYNLDSLSDALNDIYDEIYFNERVMPINKLSYKTNDYKSNSIYAHIVENF